MSTEESRDAAAVFQSGSPQFRAGFRKTFHPQHPRERIALRSLEYRRDQETPNMAVGAKIAKTADRKKIMDTTKSTDCPKCGKTTRIVKRVKDRERGVPGGVYISCSACEFFEKL
jgi:DNA-directed RNA polymerase subunit M/transcription elongation factor TFIIS